MPEIHARTATRAHVLVPMISAALSSTPGCGFLSHGDGQSEPSTEADGDGVSSYDGPRLPETPGPLSVDELGHAYEELVCEALIRCNGRPYRDVSDCRGDIEAHGLADVLDGVAEGRIDYDADAMGACRRAIQRNLCAVRSLFLFVPSVPDIVHLCAGTAPTGTQAEGEPCRGALECGRDLYCDDERSCPGVCRARKLPGAACISDEECEPAGDIPDVSLGDLLEGGQALVDEFSRIGALCVRDTCRHVSLPGDDCSALHNCAGDVTYCDFTRGKCVARGGDGHACTLGGNECAPSHFCDIADEAGSGANSACQHYGGEGEPCRTVSDCKDGLHCAAQTSDDRGLCSPASARGEACARISDCAQGLSCIDGACAELPQVGSRCAAGACAVGAVCEVGLCKERVSLGGACGEGQGGCLGLCRDGICQARLELGEHCAADTDCQSRACQDDTCIDDALCEVQ